MLPADGHGVEGGEALAVLGRRGVEPDFGEGDRLPLRGLTGPEAPLGGRGRPADPPCIRPPAQAAVPDRPPPTGPRPPQTGSRISGQVEQWTPPPFSCTRS